MLEIINYTFMQNAFFVSICISIICPCIGIFLVLRRYSMMGDTLGHSSLAGVTIALLLNQPPILGAFIFSAVCGILIEYLRNYFKKYSELILIIVLSLSVGIAITIISSGNLKENANSYLFGSILTVTQTDMIMVLILTVISVFILFLLYDQLIYIAYDEEAAKVAGVKVRLINYIFTILVAAAISVSIGIVGVLVISTLIALPVATALQLEKGFKVTLIFSIIFSFIDIMLGLIISYYLNVAPGGFTALISVLVLVIVIIFKNLRKQLLYNSN